MAEQFTMDLIDKFREAQTVVKQADVAISQARANLNAATGAWKKAVDQLSKARTEMTMAIEQRHPEQPEKGR